MHLRAAELLTRDLLANCGLHERGAREVEAASLGHQQRVAEHGQVSAAGHAVAHDRRVLRDALGRDHRVVAEDAAKVVGVGEDILLQRQEDSRAVDEVDQRHPCTTRNLLRADDLLARHREERARLHRGVVGDDHAEAALHLPDARDHTRRGRAAILAVHVPGVHEPCLEQGRARIKESFDALARGKAPMTVLPLCARRPAALLDAGRQRPIFIGSRLQPRGARRARC